MRRFAIFSLVSMGLALVHILPARHHLHDMAAAFSVSDAWKGIGAAIAVALLALPFDRQAKIVAALGRGRWLGAAAIVLAIVHVVPATDHLPKLFAAPNFGDAWKAIGATLAILWFASPRAVHGAVLRVLGRTPTVLSRHRLGIALFGAGCVLFVACGQPVNYGDDTSSGDDAGTTDDTSVTGDDATSVPDAPAVGPDGGPCTTNTGPITGSVGATGGSISRLVFAVVGDTRPANSDDPASYPKSIITKIFQDVEALSPHPPFVLGTGDYQFSSTGTSNVASKEVGYYMTARQSYTGMFFPAMGNHECGVSGSFSTSDNNNCGPGNPGGVTPNYTAFMNQMLAPISKTTPYYSFNVNASDSSWTAKFVITAANSWTTAQQTWLQGVMAQPTTYTFVVRHEASDAYPPLPPGVAGVDAIISKYPYTMLIVGHAHTYYWYYKTPNVVTFGNGGAPLTSKSYGFGLFAQRCDGAIVVDALDYQTSLPDNSFHFVITPTGTETK